MTETIDAHQHYWHPARGDYGWMPKDDPILSRPYGPADLAATLVDTGVSRTVLVQAAPSVEETEYLLGIADATPSVAGVVGWIDFERPGDLVHLVRWREHPKFLGVRPMIQDIADVDWMLQPHLSWAFEALIEFDMTFDALGFPRHLANFLALFGRHPKLRAVVDHCMKPPIGDRTAFPAWADGIRRIAGETDAFCKLSGLVTETGADWTVDALSPYAETVIAAFGPERVMWGSDWPVCRLRSEYAGWHAAALELTAGLSEPDRAAIFGGTAKRFYRL
ncbi:MAG: amidohydrolase [Rhizobiaceae bacterium]